MFLNSHTNIPKPADDRRVRREFERFAGFSISDRTDMREPLSRVAENTLSSGEHGVVLLSRSFDLHKELTSTAF